MVRLEVMVMEFSSANFMELTVQEVSDMLQQDICRSGNRQAGALLYGECDGRRFKLSVVLEVDND